MQIQWPELRHGVRAQAPPSDQSVVGAMRNTGSIGHILEPHVVLRCCAIGQKKISLRLVLSSQQSLLWAKSGPKKSPW